MGRALAEEEPTAPVAALPAGAPPALLLSSLTSAAMLPPPLVDADDAAAVAAFDLVVVVFLRVALRSPGVGCVRLAPTLLRPPALTCGAGRANRSIGPGRRRSRGDRRGGRTRSSAIACRLEQRADGERSGRGKLGSARVAIAKENTEMQHHVVSTRKQAEFMLHSPDNICASSSDPCVDAIPSNLTLETLFSEELRGRISARMHRYLRGNRCFDIVR